MRRQLINQRAVLLRLEPVAWDVVSEPQPIAVGLVTASTSAPWDVYLVQREQRLWRALETLVAMFTDPALRGTAFPNAVAPVHAAFALQFTSPTEVRAVLVSPLVDPCVGLATLHRRAHPELDPVIELIEIAMPSGFELTAAPLLLEAARLVAGHMSES